MNKGDFMNKKTIILVASLLLVIIIATVLLIIFFSPKQSVDKKYADNTSIIENTLKPQSGTVDIEKIEGFTQQTVSYIDLPFSIPDSGIEITKIGSYSDKNNDDTFAVIVKNNSDRVISYSSLSFTTNKGELTFSPTNLPNGVSSLIFPENSDIKFSDITEFKFKDKLVVNSDNLSILDSKVGIKYQDGNFVLTNLTSENLGSVYIRYKKITEGNAYLGGETYSVVQKNVEPYETYFVPCADYDAEKSVIISVESIIE